MRPRPGPVLLDSALAAVLAAASALLGADPGVGTPVQTKVVMIYGSEADWRLHIVFWWSASALLVAALLVRRRRPATAMGLAAAGVCAHLTGWPAVLFAPPLRPWSGLSRDLPLLPLDLVVLVVLYGLAGSAATRRPPLAVLIAAEAGLAVLALLQPLDAIRHDRLGPRKGEVLPDVWGALVQALSDAAVPALLLAIAWAAGDNARTRRVHLAVVEARAADLEREQEQRTALAVAAERGRITRELHDVIAHGLSVMVVQAQGAQAALHRHPERSEAALHNVIGTGRASLAEMRRLLGLVRAEARLAPQPGLAALPELIDRVRAGGRPVAFEITGEPATLPASIELSAYRIVQEALTNTLKHAEPGCSCSVGLHFGSDELRIRVHDTGASASPPVFGNGLRGIAERVTALGGTVRAGPAGQGGFEVATVLPLAAPA
ncbi:histidine kinase [Actinomadura sp. NPDC000600]|uniref:sensor histidine kinase n=1 Tax=Actinomadura sp. NPDC000600 TaxID=3154262 RepID=UPI003393621F